MKFTPSILSIPNAIIKAVTKISLVIPLSAPGQNTDKAVVKPTAIVAHAITHIA